METNAKNPLNNAPQVSLNRTMQYGNSIPLNLTYATPSFKSYYVVWKPLIIPRF